MGVNFSAEIQFLVKAAHMSVATQLDEKGQVEPVTLDAMIRVLDIAAEYEPDDDPEDAAMLRDAVERKQQGGAGKVISLADARRMVGAGA